MKTKKRYSIKIRLLLTNISFVLLAFLSVILIFNHLMSSYISSSATSQLTRVVNYQTNKDVSASDVTNLDNAPRGLLNTHPADFLISSDYTTTLSDDTSSLDRAIAKEISQELKNRQTSLSDLKNYRLETQSGTYYITTNRQSNDDYRLIYVDVTGIVNFARSVNLFLILLAVVVIAILSVAVTVVTRRLIRPLTRLAGFAKRIGKGDFTTFDYDFKDLELATLADTMNAAARQLEQDEENQKTFFQNASHELRTPLMAIKSYAEGIEYDIMAPKEASKIILSETDRMSDLVEDLLTLSRLDRLNVKEDFAPCKLQELAHDVALEQKGIANQKHIQLIEDYDKSSLMLFANYKSLRRALSNLVSNAMRYANKEIIISCKKHRQNVLLSVKNDGEPISPEDLPHLFERFYKGRGGVHGIGLAMVKAIAEQHQGRVFVKSNEQATLFIMSFPLNKKKNSLSHHKNKTEKSNFPKNEAK